MSQVQMRAPTSFFLAAMLFSIPFTCAIASASSLLTVEPELLESCAQKQRLLLDNTHALLCLHKLLTSLSCLAEQFTLPPI